MGNRIYNFEIFSQELIKESKILEANILVGINQRIWSEMLTSSYLTEEEKIYFIDFLAENNILAEELNETVWDTIKTGINNLKDTKIGKSISDKVGNAINSAKAFGSYISNLLSTTWDKLLEYFKQKFSGVKTIIKKDYEKAKDGGQITEIKLKEESENLSKSVLFWVKDLPKKIAETITGKFVSEIIEQCIIYDGSILNEIKDFNINEMDALLLKTINEADEDDNEDEDHKKKGIFGFLHKMAHIIVKLPPFNLFGKIKEFAQNGFEKIFEKFSILTKKLGGPGVYEFGIIALLAAGAVEYTVKHYMLDALEKSVFDSEIILKIIPMSKSIIHIIEWTAIFVLIVETIEELTTDIEKEEEKEEKEDKIK